MKKTILAIVLTILTLGANSQRNIATTKFNFSFERTSSGQTLPDNWFQWGKNYVLSIDSTIRHSGKNSILIMPSESRTTGSFGCIAYSIPAQYEGKVIEAKVYMKLQNVSDGTVGLMLRIDGSSGTLQFENSMTRKITGTSGWRLDSVKLAYPKGAKTIFIGAMLTGKGQLWVDDFEVLIDGVSIDKVRETAIKEYKADLDREFDNGSAIQPFRPTGQNIQDLKVLGLMWGFLKYYHPNIAAGNFNWDYELFRIIPKVLNPKKAGERDVVLADWINQFGQFEPGSEIKTDPGKIKFEPDLGWITNSGLSDELISLLLKTKNGKRTEVHFYVGPDPVRGNLGFTNENPYVSMKFPDTGYRILALYRYWNIIQYYFPYKNLIDEDWKNVLEEFIPKFINASNETEYTLSVLELIARVHDTHANIWGGNDIVNRYRGVNYAAVELNFIENKAVVTGYLDDRAGNETGLKIGDIILKVNRNPVDSIVKERLKLTPASNYPTQLRDIAPTLLRTNDTIVNVEFISNGARNNRILKAYSTEQINIRKKYQVSDTCFKLIGNDIAYINNGSLKIKYLPAIWKDIKNTKGLVIDLRNYPSDFPIYELSRYLLPKSTPFVKATTGSVIIPGLFTFNDSLSMNAGEENKDYYRGKVCILINEISVSSAEFHAMAYRIAPNATVIGSTTAGADGNVAAFSLPGGISTGMSGIGIYYPDGTETQRIGIVPDVEKRPTIEGIKNGRDELLEKAIEIINEQ
jgi:C-terminal processing protease CtpA/Prc